MKRAFNYLLLCWLLSLSVPFSAFAENLFAISYEKKVVSSDENTVSGVLILHITNVSGQDVHDVVASVSGINNITYDNHPIMVGNLTEAQPFGTLDEFTVPTLMTEVEVPEGTPVVWLVEYTGQDNVRHTVEVEGRAIQ